MPFDLDATFWATASLVLFIALIVYLKVPPKLGKALDDRSDEIRAKLDEARNLREEAQQLLAEYQRKRKEAEQEAESIVQAAKRDAKLMLEDAKRKEKEYMERRDALFEQKIAHAEAAALAEIKSVAVDLALEASRKVIEEKMTPDQADRIFKDGLAEIKNRLN